MGALGCFLPIHGLWPMNTVFFYACLHMYISTLHNCMTKCIDTQLAFTFSFVFVSLVIVQKISVVVRLLPHTKKALGSIPLEACLKLVCSLHVQVLPSKSIQVWSIAPISRLLLLGLTADYVF